VIINKTTLDQKVDEFTFEEGEAYTVDIVMSTGEGKVSSYSWMKCLSQTTKLPFYSSQRKLSLEPPFSSVHLMPPTASSSRPLTTLWARSTRSSLLCLSHWGWFFSLERVMQSKYWVWSNRAIEDEKRAKMGIVELVKHDLVHSYPVLFEKQGEFVAQTKFTVLLLSSQISRITRYRNTLQKIVGNIFITRFSFSF